MKTFLKIDYYFQLLFFIGYIISGVIYSFMNSEFFSSLFLFYFVVGGAQLISYLIRLTLGFWSDLFFKIYGIMILPIWLIFLLYFFGISIDFLFFITYLGVIYSPFLAIAYLFYCKEKSNDYTVKL